MPISLKKHFEYHSGRYSSDLGFPLNVLKILYPAGEGSNSLFYADDHFREIVSMVPEGCRITIISDSCHSGGLIEQAKEQIGNSFLGCPIKEQAEEPTGEEEDGQGKDGLKKKSVPFSALVDMLKQKTGREEVSRSQMTPALSEVAPFNASISALDLLGAPTAPTTSTELVARADGVELPGEERGWHEAGALALGELVAALHHLCRHVLGISVDKDTAMKEGN